MHETQEVASEYQNEGLIFCTLVSIDEFNSENQIFVSPTT
jgi:hypothetical protein